MLLKYMIFAIAITNMIKTTTQSVVPCPESLGKGVCKNNGFCVILFNRDIQCTCPVGFRGIFCEISITTTLRSTPAPTTTTTTLTASFLLCPPGQGGCLNNGVCVITIATGLFRCVCPAGFSGLFCQNRT